MASWTPPPRAWMFLGKEDPIAKLGHAIAGRGGSFFVLDNFEQVAEHAPPPLGKRILRFRRRAF